MPRLRRLASRQIRPHLLNIWANVKTIAAEPYKIVYVLVGSTVAANTYEQAAGLSRQCGAGGVSTIHLHWLLRKECMWRVKFVLHDRDASLTAASGEVFRADGARIIRAAVQAPRMNSIMERWAGSCRHELLDRTVVRNQRHLMIMLREYEDCCNTHRPYRALNQAAPLRPLLDGVTHLDHFRVRRRDRVGGVIHECRLVA